MALQVDELFQRLPTAMDRFARRTPVLFQMRFSGNCNSECNPLDEELKTSLKPNVLCRGGGDDSAKGNKLTRNTNVAVACPYVAPRFAQKMPALFLLHRMVIRRRST
ncbi:hypothetical protein PPYR_03399 [Photinus pyralis]|uniref:Uncharacterized protein n=1 Tax=Photinus pyralis TaxID=7054 RepID=A0A5N4A2U6_PHOPY|nr:hypothetical protein PPYR_03399 [Photinus pyralis]